MSESLLNKNLCALKRHPAAYNRVLHAAKSFSADSYRVEKSRSGEPTLEILESGHKPFAYHSRYDPVKEAEKQIQATYEQQTHILLLGFGLGYMAEQLLANLPVKLSGLRLFVIEPDAAVMVAAMHSRDFSGMFADGRVALCAGFTPDEVGDFWNANLDWTILDRLAIIDHPPSMARFKKYFERVVEKIRYLCNRSKGNLVTLMHAGFEFHSNYFANLVAGFDLPGIGRLFGKFTGAPAIIVAAGPSLDKNIHLLHNVKGRFPIIAVDTALRQLVANGIKPDIVCAADPSYENSLDFVGVENEKDVILAIEPMTHPDIFASFKGPKMLMTFGSGLFPIFKDLREPVGNLSCWGSIATTVFDLVRNMGSDPIVFIGLDLSFQDGRLHARGSYSDDVFFEKVHQFTSIEHETADYINTRGTYKFVMTDGSVVYTDQNMKLYRDWFEDQFRQTTAKVINATEGGVVDKYVEKMSLSGLIAKYSDFALPVGQIIQEAISRPVVADKNALLNRLVAFRKSISQNESSARKAVVMCRKILVSSAALLVNNLAGRIRAEFFDLMQLHDKICEEKDLFGWFSIHQAKFMTRHSMEILALKADEKTTVGQWLSQLSEFFAALGRFHEYQIPLLEQAIMSLRNSSYTIQTNEGEQR